MSRKSVTVALNFISTTGEAYIDDSLAEDLLENIQTIDTQTLKSCLGNSSPKFLRLIATELQSRSELEKDHAEQLCASPDAETRLIGVAALKKFRDVSIDEAQKIIVRPVVKNENAIFSREDRDSEGEEAFKKYTYSELNKKDLVELSELELEESLYRDDVLFVIYNKYFKKYKSAIEINLLDGFNNFCLSRIKRYPILKEPSDNLFNFIRKEFLQKSFEIYCSKIDSSGLSIVRQVLERGELHFSIKIAKFFAKFGTWEDISRIFILYGNKKYSGLLISAYMSADLNEENRNLASVLFSLGGKRIADLWNLDMPNPVRAQLISVIPDSTFRKFHNDILLTMLLSPVEIIRSVAALKIVNCFNSERISGILDMYYKSEGTYYYNVIFWLDLGISANKKVANSLARNFLVKKQKTSATWS